MNNSKDSKFDLKKIVIGSCKVLIIAVRENDIKRVFNVKSKSGKSIIIADFTRTIIIKQDLLNGQRVQQKKMQPKI